MAIDTAETSENGAVKAQDKLRTAIQSRNAKEAEDILLWSPSLRLDNQTISLAAWDGEIAVFDVLFRHDSSIINRELPQGVPLALALSTNQPLPFIEYLLDQDADPNWRSCPLRSILWFASIHPDSAVVKLILDRGASVLDGGALARAAYYGRTDIIKLLLSRGADPNGDKLHVPNPMFSQPLQEAAGMNRLEACRMLLDHGADPNRKDGSGRSAVDFAKQQNRDRILDLFEEYQK